MRRRAGGSAGAPRTRTRSIRARLVIWNIVALMAVFAALGVVVHFFVRTTMLAAIDRDLMMRVQRFRLPPDFGPEGAPNDGPGGPGDGARSVPDGGGPGGGGPGGGGPGGDGGPMSPGGAGDPRSGPRDDPGRRRDDGNPLRPRLYDLAGKPLRSGSTVAVVDPQGLRRAAAVGNAISTVTYDSGTVRAVSRRVSRRGVPVAVIQTALSLEDVYRAASELDRALLLLAPLAVLLAGLGGLAVTRSVLKPVDRLTRSAAGIGAQDLSARLEVVGDDEFAHLASTFNAMLERLETAFLEQRRLVEQQRRFVADASHELRTPLTVVKGNTSLCLATQPDAEGYRRAIEEIDRAAGGMSRLVQDLLLLARADADRLGRDPIELPVHEAVERAVSGMRPGGAAVRVEPGDPGLCVSGNEDEVTRVFTNLLDNAARWTPADGRITVRAVRESGAVCVTVADTGAGIAPEHLPHLGERFYRVDPSRSRGDGGSGLGLSICRSIVEAHGGSIEFASEPGAGTTVTVRLPALEPAPETT